MSNINAKPVAKNKSKLFIFEGSCQFLIPPTGLNFNPIIVSKGTWSERRHLTTEIRVPKSQKREHRNLNIFTITTNLN